MSDPKPNPPEAVEPMERGLERVLGGALVSARELRSRRVTLISGLGLVSTTIYAINDAMHGAYATACIHVFGFLSLLATRYAQVRLKNLNLACHLLLVSMGFVLCVAPFPDGNIYSPGLWCAALLPFGAAFLFNEKMVLRYAAAVLVVISLHLLLGPYVGFSRVVTNTPDMWAQMRFMFLFVLSGLSMVSAGSSLRTQRFLEARTTKLKQDIEEANVAERSKSAFLTKMSHEIRMPVLAIRDLTERTSQLGFSEHLQSKLAAMRSSSGRLLYILDSVLDLARLEAGNVELREIDVSPSGLVEALHAQYAPLARKRGISLRTRVAVGPLRFQGDPKRIYQVLSSLVDNALKFSDAGQVEISVSASSGPEDGCSTLRFAVKDEGIGMTEDQLSRVFGRFSQVHDDARGGCGLGLAIANRLAQRMDAALEAQSTPGQGSTFSLTLNLPHTQDQSVDLSWSRTLGLDELAALPAIRPLRKARKQVVEKPASLSRSTVQPMGYVMLPLVVVLILGNLWGARYTLASVQALGALLLLAAPYPLFAKTPNRRVGLFLAGLALALFPQSLFEGNIQSETLWSVALVPIVAAYLLGFGSAIASTIVCSGFIIFLTYFPQEPLRELAYGQGLLHTVALRFASLIGFTGSSLIMAKGAQQAIAAMQSNQSSVAQLSEQALQSNQEKARFLQRISDEIETPMRHIIDVANMVASDPQLDSPQRALVTSIERCTGHVSELFARTLKIAELGAPVSVAQTSLFDLQHLIEDACQLFEFQGQRKGLKLKLIANQPTREIQGDASALLEILAVLLSNAMRFSQEGTVTVTLEIQSAESLDKGTYSVRVQDTGAGIPKARIDEIERASHDAGLSSSALSRAMAQAKAMGGRLEATSQLGKGSVFTLHLPWTAHPAQLQAA